MINEMASQIANGANVASSAAELQESTLILELW